MARAPPCYAMAGGLASLYCYIQMPSLGFKIRGGRGFKGGGHCVKEWDFVRTFLGNQEVPVRLKSDLIF